MEIDGRAIAASTTAVVKAAAAELTAAGTTPTLGILSATKDESTAYYVRSLMRAAARVGITTELVSLPGTATTEEFAAACERLALDPNCHGIIAQTPFPPGIDQRRVVETIPPWKDIDGATPLSAGLLMHGHDAFAPATAQAVIEILKSEKVELSGANVTVVGQSLVVGRPLVQLLLAEEATVTCCHVRTRDLVASCRDADIIVVAAGRPNLIGRDHVREGAVVIDVGTNATDDGLVGDVDFEAVKDRASKITPVPGGVGPVTTACLLAKIVRAANAAHHSR
jgi:methylenetetrahydrofolate dehydrogenase (NADP+)/methenyltetrahydrofolate cyclohydrolase